nr:hypothetical protein [Tanacetum cinerariifolium]
MSFSTISISLDTTGESIRSSALFVILSDTKIEVMVVPAVLPKIAPEVETSVVASPIAVSDLVLESNPEADHLRLRFHRTMHKSLMLMFPLHLTTIQDRTQSLRPLRMSQRSHLRMTHVRQLSLYLLRVYLYHKFRVASLFTLCPSLSSRLSLSSSLSETSSSSSETSSSSSGTSYTPSGPLPRRRQPLSSYSTPSPFFGASRKRCRSPTTSLPAAAPASATLSYVTVDCLPPRKTFRGSLTLSFYYDTIETATELVIPPVYLEHTIDDRLDEIEEELQTLRARVASSKREITSLRAKVKATELYSSLLEPPTDLSLTLHYYVNKDSHHQIIKVAMRKPLVAKNVDLGLLPSTLKALVRHILLRISKVESSTSDSLKCKSRIDTACDGRLNSPQYANCGRFGMVAQHFEINVATMVILDENFIKVEFAAATPEETTSGSLSQSFSSGRPHTIKVLLLPLLP